MITLTLAPYRRKTRDGEPVGDPIEGDTLRINPDSIDVDNLEAVPGGVRINGEDDWIVVGTVQDVTDTVRQAVTNTRV